MRARMSHTCMHTYTRICNDVSVVIFSVATFHEHSNLGSPERADAICRMGTHTMHTAAGAANLHLAMTATKKITLTGLDSSAMGVWTGFGRTTSAGCLKQGNGSSCGGYGARARSSINLSTYFKQTMSRCILRKLLSSISAQQATIGDKVSADASTPTSTRRNTPTATTTNAASAATNDTSRGIRTRRARSPSAM